MLFKSTGYLQYSRNHQLVVRADQGLADFYRHLIPKYYGVQRGRWPAHVTVVREVDGLIKEVPTNMDAWGKYQGEEIDFMYENIIRQGKIYFWLNIFCVRLEEIRSELGLSIRSQYTIPPEGFTKCFHMTLGNMKGL
tara:strand:+ start:1793 stop:2203 length:411 start_codon:yes stop_codon:yes gene_type:complete